MKDTCMKHILALIIVLSTSISLAFAYKHSDGCNSICFGPCEDYSDKEMPAVKCAQLEPTNSNICKVMFGDCGRLENGQCGWKPTADFQTCLNDPQAYQQKYIQWQENLELERLGNTIK